MAYKFPTKGGTKTKPKAGNKTKSGKKKKK